ncbi:MAG: alanine racemase, partial [Actinobacteria bacterium]|nr:alanine racemase [Gemmatimonadota bacterium]NIR42019.1 alanine racemase [Actinomycetota bacterium]NIU80194.1 alanine racemase [Gammaproteobacteria bacterium]NIU22727.1 alanine racemase [Actinomycetota bacterium]NIV90943.1 alanine racemase [Actinomycetota bacterium]
MRPTWIEIDLGAIRDNVAAIAAAVAPAEVCAVVKADGYGHGDVPVAEAAREGGARWLAVALVAEGARLREAGVQGPILLLSEPFPEEISEIVRWELTPTVYRESFVEALAGAAPAGYPVHLKVDTGMHRVGSTPEAAGRIAALVDRVGLRLEGVWTHFAVSEEDPAYTAEQTARLLGFVGALGSPAARLDMVRAGIGIYGLRPAPGFAPEVPLRPAMRVVSHVSFVQRLAAGECPSYGRVRPLPAEATVATVPIGYADGVPRRLREAGGEVLIRGRRYPFAGTVTMDQ